MTAQTPEAQAPAPKPARKRRWRSYLVDVALLIAVVVGVSLFNARGVAKGAAPAIEGVDLQGKPVSLAGYRGQAVLVQFWATWCSVCAMENGSIDSIAKDKPVIAVADDSDSAAEIAAWMKARKLSFPVVVDPGGRYARAYGVTGFPTSFFVDGQGQIRFAEVGYTTELGMRARLWLAGR